MKRALIFVFLFLAVAPTATAQADALAGLLDNATDFDFSGTWLTIPYGELKPERNGVVSGVGFELAFSIPGGIGQRHVLPKNPRAKADSVEPILTLELAVGFSQAGALVSRHSSTDLRTSVREMPSVSLFGSVGDRAGGYIGARTGLVTLTGGRAYINDTAIEFDGNTFQLGPVLGAFVNVWGLNIFAEGSYMWRDIKSIEWESDAVIGDAPRSANLSGPGIAVGVQFQFKKTDKD